MGKIKITVPGILVVAPAKKPKITTYEELEKGTKPDSLAFEFRVTNGSPANPLFYSSPRLRKLIAEHPELMGRMLGHISYSGFAKTGKELHVTQSTYPFDNLRFLGSSAEEVGSGMIRKGMAIELERKVLAEMRKRFGKFIIFSSGGFVFGNRFRQIKKRGIAVDVGYSVHSDRMLAGINKVRREERKKRRPMR